VAVGDMFELRVEFQDLIVDVALTLPCACAAAYARPREPGRPAAACLGCRARYVMALGRQMRGWSPLPRVGVRHTAGPAYRSVEITLTPGGRARPPKVVGGRQTCIMCGVTLFEGPGAGYAEPGEVVVKLEGRTRTLGDLVALGLTGRDAREPQPGEIECAALARDIHLTPDAVTGSPDATRWTAPSVDGHPIPRRRRARRAAGPHR
jgi:hypothetical protein